jgi:hypothetical protein
MNYTATNIQSTTAVIKIFTILPVKRQIPMKIILKETYSGEASGSCIECTKAIWFTQSDCRQEAINNNSSQDIPSLNMTVQSHTTTKH